MLINRLFLFVLCLVSACGPANQVEAPRNAVIQLSDAFSSEFALVNHHGVATTNEDFRGRVAVIYFGFSSCPDVCPLALGTLSAALSELSDRDQQRLAPLFITVDPERDTPETIAAFLRFDERITGLTGDRAAIDVALKNYKIYAQKQLLPDSAAEYTYNHQSLFFVVDRKGAVRYAIKDSVTPQELASLLRKAARG